MVPAALGISENSQLLFLAVSLADFIGEAHCEYPETLSDD